MNRIITLLGIFLIVLIGFFVTLWIVSNRGNQTAASFQECLEAGFAVQESYPRRCVTPDGKTFVEDIGNELEKINLIKTELPRPNSVLSSPLIITGQARGSWFWEAQFPVRLLDGNGNLVSSTAAQAQGEWMTADFVPFSATLTFQKPDTKKGTLILQKDNPSGLSEHDDALIIPILFE